MALLITPDQNRLKFTAEPSELTEVILDLASGKLSYENLLEWVHSRIE